MLERFGHGGDLKTARETFGFREDEFLDYSSNMNPFGPPPCVERILKERWQEVVRYPDPAVRELRACIAKKYNIPEEAILAGNGAAELIDLVIRVLKPQVTGIARPSFSEYEEAVHKTGKEMISIPLREENDFDIQVEDVEKAFGNSDILFLGQPNNPTGRLLPEQVHQLIKENQHPVILDEAFLDFHPAEEKLTLIREAASSRHLFVIRSMTKFYAIPGIRLGFIVAHPDWIRKLKEHQVHWSVNMLAQLIGAAVFEEKQYEVKTRAWLQDEKEWMQKEFRNIGFQVTPTETNFMLFAFPKEHPMNIKQLQERLGRKGILIRDASLFPGLNARYGRVAIRFRQDNMKLVAALRETVNV